MKKEQSILRRGFTLIEVLVATVIMVVIVLAVVSVASDTFRAYDRAVADLSTQSEARSVLDAMENDFQTAVIRPDGRCWMEVVLPTGASSPVAAGLTGAPPVPGNLRPSDAPIVMLFSSPSDRPRWSPERSGGVRQPLRGDVCAVAYRIGHRSPFDMPGELIQRVYGVYRTMIDPESTFSEALPVILSNAAPAQPWDYWTGGVRRVPNYAASDTGGQFQTKVLLNDSIIATPPCWTLDDQNFIGSNIVAMNLIFWCSSSLPATAPAGVLSDPAGRAPQMLRPVLMVGNNAALDSTGQKFGSTALGGYAAAFRTATTKGSVRDAAIRYATAGAPALQAGNPTGIQPMDNFVSRLRVCSDRMYPDSFGPTSTVTAGKLPYLPYSLRAVEISLTVLTPEGSKELRALQHLGGNSTLSSSADFRRIVFQNGRTYTRYVRLLGNGG
ncbi:MAG: PulJ/GspJ family protein [Opitutales bacterium]